jgi:glucokinase
MNAVYAGVDLGGTTIHAALATRAGDILCQETIPTESHAGPVAVLKRIAELVRVLAARIQADPQAVGMGVPGLVDVASGTTRFLPNLPTQWRDVEAGRILSEQLGCPVRLLNDVRIATLGELTYGHGREAQSLVFLALGTGIGGGVAVDGQLRLGPLGAAGELGHLTILPDGPLCGCGNRGCLETLASGPAIIGEAVRLLKTGLAPRLFDLVQGDAGRVSPKEIAAAAQAGDAAVQDSLRRASEYLGIGVANVIVTLHPDLVVFGGGVAQMGDVLLEPVRETVRRRVRMFPSETVRIEISQLGDRAGVLGAVALACRPSTN